MTVSLIKHTALEDRENFVNGRQIIPAKPEGWHGIALMEWELTAAEWTDRHPHDEVNFVLEGELHVESEGETVIATAGDTVVVAAGSAGRYVAPTHARMLAIYGPNPDGAESDSFHYHEFEQPG